MRLCTGGDYILAARLTRLNVLKENFFAMWSGQVGVVAIRDDRDIATQCLWEGRGQWKTFLGIGNAIEGNEARVGRSHKEVFISITPLPNPLETVEQIVQILRPYAYSDLACAPCVLARYSSTFYGNGIRPTILKAPRIQNADNPS